MRQIITVFALILTLSSLAPLAALAEASPDNFISTWRLLSPIEKQQFVSGYVFGWKDAQKVSEIAVRLAQENPQSAGQSLRSLSQIYDLGQIEPETLTKSIDRFYSDPDNQAASLSAAVTAARSGKVQ